MSWILRVLLLAVMFGCSPPRAFDTSKALNSQKTSTVAADNSFGVDLCAELNKTEKGNIFFSPYSIRTSLAMTYAGARGNTATQMASVLHFGMTPSQELHPVFASLIKSLNDNDKNYDLTVANALWGQSGFEFQKDFQDILQTNYGAALHELNFAQSPEPARLEINNWVEKQTRHKIKDLLAEGTVDSLTRLVLTNAIYFKGQWAEPFYYKATHEEPFHLDGTHDVPKLMMHHPTATLRYFKTDLFQAVELPYAGDKLSMVLIVPKAIDGLATVQKKITAENLNQWLANMQNRSVVLTMPKFTMTGEFSLADTLKNMGMTDAFDRDHADFSGMAFRKTEPLYLSQVVHKAFVTIDEKGTEAAAANSTLAARGGGEIQVTPPKFVNADRPFLFLIRHQESGAILFIGRLVDPGLS